MTDTDRFIGRLLSQLGLAHSGTWGDGTPRLPGQETDLILSRRQLAGLDARLDAILKSNRTDTQGRAFRIDLDKVRDRLGAEKWARNTESIHQRVSQIIEDRLTDSELFIRLNEFSYLLIFTALSQKEGQLKSTALAEEIARTSVGLESALDFVDLKTMVLDRDGNPVFDDVPASGNIWQLVSETLAASGGQTAKPKETSSETPNFNPTEIRFIYRPLLAVRTKVISTFLSIPVRTLKDGGFASNYGVLENSGDAKQIFELDRLTLHHVARELAALIKKRGRSLLAVPVHFETLAASKKRIDYAALCSKAFSGHENRVIFELMGLPDGVPQQRLIEIVSSLRPNSRAVIARFDSAHSNFTAFRTAGLHAVGMDVFNTGKTETALMKEMDTFIKNARQNQLKCYVEGIRSLSLFTIAIASGFDYVAGYAISPPADNAVDIHAFQLASPFKRLLDSLSGKIND